ncbi:GTPase HflX [Candidatus Uabimicrobium helgolandensis]
MKFHSKPVPEHKEVPVADNRRWEKIIEQSVQRDTSSSQNNDINRCYILSVSYSRDPLVQQAQLLEIVSLVKAQGDTVVGEEVYYLTKERPQTLIGKGTSQEIAERAHALNADLLVLDAELSPSQMRNLEDASGIAICDREAIILNVFLRHAKTRSAQIQIEIAQLQYLRPRIRGIGLDMDQQTGGISGSRGAGETASELLARKLDGRLAELKKAQSKLERVDKNHREKRNKCKRITLVGYTNAGKTSLMNALVKENLSSRNMPFETLDTTSRCLTRHGGDVIISDTVGFIRRLPNSLLASFETTLAEMCSSSLIVVVIDVSDYEWQEHLQITISMLEKLKAEDIPRCYVFNKLDCVSVLPSCDLLSGLVEEYNYEILSSKDKSAVDKLKEKLLQMVRSEEQVIEFVVPYTANHIMSLIYGKTRVIESKALATEMYFRVEGSPQVMAKIEHDLKELI